MAILQAENVTVGYISDIFVLQGANFYVNEGEIAAIVGPNGAGKSTLLKTLYGFLHPSAGRIVYRGKDVTRRSPEQFLRMGIAYVPQQTQSLFPDLTVHENLELGCWIMRHDKARVKRALERAYERFPVLAQKRRARTATLSGGQQRTLELARALLTEPNVLMMDEPTAMLSPAVSKEIYRFLRAVKEDGVTVVLVDQHVTQAMEIADYVWVLEMGKEKHHGPKDKMEKAMRDIIRSWVALEEKGLAIAGGEGNG